MNINDQAIEIIAYVTGFGLLVTDSYYTHSVNEIEINGVTYNMGGSTYIWVAPENLPPPGTEWSIKIR